MTEEWPNGFARLRVVEHGKIRQFLSLVLVIERVQT